MSSVNKVILIGRLGKDPEVKYISDNVAVANFPLATSESYIDKTGQKQENTEWHNIVVWRKLAEIAEKYLEKGKLIYLEGKLRTRSWEDKDGNKRYTTEVFADNFTMLGTKAESSATNEQPKNNKKTDENTDQSESPDVNADEEDDLPF